MALKLQELHPVSTAPGAVVGREPELAAVAHLLDRVGEGPAVLLFAGEAGIGKTTLWRAGVEAAGSRNFGILACRPAAAEVRMQYAGLFDLLGGIGEEGFAHLPKPQRRALDAVLLRGDHDPAPDPRMVAAAVLSVIEELATQEPLLLAIDDLQWLDPPTRRVVEFVVRRCSGPAAVLATVRCDEPSGRAALVGMCPRNPARAHRVELGPLSLAALHHLLRARTGKAIPRPTLVHIVQASGGNPFYALELAASVSDDDGRPTRLPDSLATVVRDRLGRLAPDVRDALLVVSALTAPRIDLVRRVTESDDVVRLLMAAEEAGVVELCASGAVSFTHPLLATGMYGEATPTVRRALHKRVAAVVDNDEERARHLALAALGPEAATVAALDTAAGQARRRGAPADAAQLLELAIRLGADDAMRRVRAAQDHFHAGNLLEARSLAQSAVDELDAGPTRAAALALVGTLRFELDNNADAVSLLRQALDEAADDPGLCCSITLELAHVRFQFGQPEDVSVLTTLAVALAEQAGEDGLLAEALAVREVVGFVQGEHADPMTMARALELEDPDRRSRLNVWPTLLAGLIHRWSHDLDAAATSFAAAWERGVDQGRDSELWVVAVHAVPTACATGDLDTAEEYVGELAEQAQLSGNEQLRAIACAAQAQLWAWSGSLDDARAAGDRALATLSVGDAATFRLIALAALGHAELSAGNHQEAASWFDAAVESAMGLGIDEPAAVLPFLADAAETLTALGRFADAEPLVALLEACGKRPDRAWAQAVGARCRGLLLAAAGDCDAAMIAFEEALRAHNRLPQLRYDRARTQLVLGQHQRRCNQRRRAQTSLEEAARLFDEVGCQQWARNARAELDRLGLQPGNDDGLTPTEQRVAELASSGMTVREVAATLFVSPKTVEAHITRIYRKLGIRSRAELGRWVAEHLGEGVS